jgi:hypothetical protein
MSYEFTEDQNLVITNLTNYMKITAYVTVIVGLIDLLEGLIAGSVITVLASLSIIAIGIVFYFPIDNLKRIVKTEGSDIKELMQAFSDLNKGWTIVIGVLLIAVFFSIINWVV